ncbi:MAG: RNA binding S1 protein [Parcubacteria group bacterium Gr01-1014_48]|nr:MAG: RNA binding S1 protein [Parcubacteria group bacterium Greene0416_14]TSC73702.1 MAG: RNA binding S1 protein [Parcubacteria group bacterium Gr01-1014_48]TSC98972.1 MAG: RNA binding S1 protein [Parcubacteria group bacterium Greene1014_15]TSD06895.1 MAG: RNA binding S1 protein [Parcubacteria group bacterium Greene0714_4]
MKEDADTDIETIDTTEGIKTSKESGKEEKDKKTETLKKKKPEGLMSKMLMNTSYTIVIGELVEGPVIAIDKAALYIDLPPYRTGIIYGREFINARDVIRKVHIGDMIAAKIVEEENKDGYVELSLKEARQALIWSEAETLIREKRVIDLPVKEANKGGLILEWQGIQGFLPASQLKSDHYPRVKDGDKDKILEELKKLVGEKISVSILSVLPQEGKLIFSEKSGEQVEKQGIIDKYQVGDEVSGEITGMVDFGVFVKLEEGLEGLVHISEIDWSLVEDPRKLFTVGQKVQVKIIEIKDGKISLSIKALKENPWTGAAKKYKKGDRVNGVIIKYNKHGALASIEEGVAGLIHISEFTNEEKLKETLELGKSYPFIITLFDAEEQRMALSYQSAKEKVEPTVRTKAK